MLLTYVRHVPSTTPLPCYAQGDIGCPSPGQRWYIACPSCNGTFSLHDHTIIVHADETLTVTPSLLCPGSDRLPCTAHYYINRNVLSWIT